MLALIPFAGLYDSWHDDSLDNALEQMFDGQQELASRAFDAVNWPAAHTAYAKAYAEAFLDEFKIKAAFESMTSPREYNFMTDRIFITISEREARRLFNETPREALVEVAKEMFTSRDGFSSFYSPDHKRWGPVTTWDHNELLALITAHVGPFDEFDLLDSWRGNAGPDSCIFAEATPELERLSRIGSYLRTRSERQYR